MSSVTGFGGAVEPEASLNAQIVGGGAPAIRWVTIGGGGKASAPGTILLNCHHAAGVK